jgi:hypothetical protein
MDWATFWAMFSLTHLVTLAVVRRAHRYLQSAVDKADLCALKHKTLLKLNCWTKEKKFFFLENFWNQS